MRRKMIVVMMSMALTGAALAGCVANTTVSDNGTAAEDGVRNEDSDEIMDDLKETLSDGDQEEKPEDMPDGQNGERPDAPPDGQDGERPEMPNGQNDERPDAPPDGNGGPGGNGKTVSIVGTDGTTYVTGTGSYTITVDSYN